MSYVNKRVYVRKKLQNDTWETFSNAILLTEATEIEVSEGIGKKKDTFDFNINNSNNRCFRTYHSGDASTTAFTLKWSPIPSDFLGNEGFRVFVGTTEYQYTPSSPGSTQYTLNAARTIMTFGSAPASGTNNIEVRFTLVAPDDLVRIYRWVDSTWDALGSSGQNNALYIEGAVSEPVSTINDSGRILSIRGTGIIEAVFNALVFLQQKTDSSGNPTSDVVAEAGSSGSGALQRVVTQINNFDNASLKQLVWASDNDVTTKSIQYASRYRTALEIFEELTSHEYTGVGQMYYYVTYDPDADNFLIHLKKSSLDTQGTLTEGSSNIKNIKVSYSTAEVVNKIIFNAGQDPYGHWMEFNNFRYTGAPKWKYITSTQNIGEDILNDEFDKDTGEWATTDDGNRKSNFPIDYDNDWLDADGDWDFAFPKRDSSGDVISGSPSASDHVSATSEATFADAVIEEARARGIEKTNYLLDLFEYPRIKCSITIDAPNFSRTTYILGDTWTLDIPSFGLFEKRLRITQMDHSFWDSTIHFEEDETLISGQIEA